MSQICNLYKEKACKGFTLIEIMVVMALIAIASGFVIPKFNTGAFNGSSRKVSRWLQLKIPTLKSKAVADQKAYVLKVDLDSGKLWSEDMGSDESENENTENKPFEFPDNISIKDVVFADGEQHTSGAVDIVFYPKGYSDKVVIHTEDDHDNTLSFFIEPFLSNIKIVPGYSGFDD